MDNENISLEYNLVAFIDILGFSEMVKSDIESPIKTDKYLDRLYRVHKRTEDIKNEGLEVNIVQFSDSVVLSMPYKPENLKGFIEIISKYQFDLFCEGILSRGGIALGKHFYKEGFMYSLGLIEAYKIESQISRFPRVVISWDLLNLVYPSNDIPSEILLIKENDGYYFVDYLIHHGDEAVDKYLSMILSQIDKIENASIKEKYIWLAEYIKFKFQHLGLGLPDLHISRHSRLSL